MGFKVTAGRGRRPGPTRDLGGRQHRRAGGRAGAPHREFHRILRVGGVARVALPDYHAPRAVRRVFWNATVAAEHRISRGHHAFTSFASVRPFVDASPFEAAYWLHYWDASALEGRPPAEDEPLPFMRNPIDYGLGFVKRTPDHPTMNQGVTSVVVDLVKLAR